MAEKKISTAPALTVVEGGDDKPDIGDMVGELNHQLLYLNNLLELSVELVMNRGDGKTMALLDAAMSKMKASLEIAENLGMLPIEMRSDSFA